MLRILDDKNEIAKSQKQLESILKKNSDLGGQAVVGYQGGNQNLHTWWSKRLGIWVGFKQLSNRYWNAFGTYDPFDGFMVSITCEINSPKSGINRRIAGGFAKDDSNKVFLIHRGNIGGSKLGVGKTLFVSQFIGDFESVVDGDRETDVAIIGELNDKHFLRQLSSFVYEVERIKQLGLKSKKPKIEPKTIVFNKEFSGQKKYSSSRVVVANCDHGIVVNELKNEVTNFLNSKKMIVGNDINRDLYVSDANQGEKILFEVKSASFTTKYYEAIGQLLYHSAAKKKKPILVAVFPNDLSSNAIEILKTIGIEVVRFKWQGDSPVFIGLEKVVGKLL